jgi:hypothetical protein
MLCLKGITFLVVLVNTGIPGLPKDVSLQIRQAWPDMYPWVTYTLDHYLVRMHYDMPSIDSPEHGLTVNIIDMLLNLSRIPHLPHAIGNSRGFMKLIANVWLTSTAYTLALLEHLNDFLGCMIGQPQKRTGPKSWVEQFESTLKSSTLDVGRPLVFGIASALQNVRPLPLVLARYLLAVHSLDDENFPQLSSLLKSGSVYWLSRLISRMTNQDYTKTLSDEQACLAADTLVFAYGHLYYDYDKSFLYVSEALSNPDFLLSIVTSGFYLKAQRRRRENANTLRGLLKDTIRKIHTYQVIVSVLNHAIKPFRVVQETEENFKRELLVQAPEVLEAWLHFVEDMKNRMVLRDKFNREINKKCENPKVS